MDPHPYQISTEAYGEPIYMVSNPGPGVTIGRHGVPGGTPAYLVSEPFSGVRTVWFVNGPPPGSSAWFFQQHMQQQPRHAAWTDAQSRTPDTAASSIAEQHLLQQ